MVSSTAVVRTTAGVIPASGIMATMFLASGVLSSAQPVREVPSVQHDTHTHFVTTLRQITVHQRELSTSPVIVKVNVMPSMSIAEAALRAEIEKYEGLGAGWDGYGAEPASKEALGDLLRFLDQMPAGIDFPKITLASSGLPSLYWDSSDFFADLEFSEDAEVSLFTTVKNGGKELYFPFSSVEDAAGKIGEYLSQRSV